jgi:hypothetical protein
MDVQICRNFQCSRPAVSISAVQNTTPVLRSAGTIFGRCVALQIVRRGGNGRDLFLLPHFFWEDWPLDGVQIDAGIRSHCCVFRHIKSAGAPYGRVAASGKISESVHSTAYVRGRMVSASCYGKRPSAAQHNRACHNGLPKPACAIGCILQTGLLVQS